MNLDDILGVAGDIVTHITSPSSLPNLLPWWLSIYDMYLTE